MKLSIKQISFSALLGICLLTLMMSVALVHGQTIAITAEPETVRSGEMVDVRGEGFEAGSAVRISVHGHSDTLKIARADAAGTFIVEVVIPANMPDGVHMLMARDESGEMAHFGLTVDSAAARVPLQGTIPYIIGGMSIFLLVTGVVLLRIKGDDPHA